jgi:hypothetical protein
MPTPQSVMLAIHCKKSEAVDVKTPLIAFIRATYSDREADDAADDIERVQSLRAEVVNAQSGAQPGVRETLSKCDPSVREGLRAAKVPRVCAACSQPQTPVRPLQYKNDACSCLCAARGCFSPPVGCRLGWLGNMARAGFHAHRYHRYLNAVEARFPVGKEKNQAQARVWKRHSPAGEPACWRSARSVAHTSASCAAARDCRWPPEQQHQQQQRCGLDRGGPLAVFVALQPDSPQL